jgi:hypothetical protein
MANEGTQRIKGYCHDIPLALLWSFVIAIVIPALCKVEAPFARTRKNWRAFRQSIARLEAESRAMIDLGVISQCLQLPKSI